MLKIGSLVDGKYRVLSEIGHGGMSVVYMAINEKANKTWAIKEVRKDGIKDFEVVRQGLIVETEMLKRLSHPNLPSIVDVIENEDTFLIVMDYIEGNPLSKSLEEFGAQPQEYVIDWAKQLCDVLDYLHTRNPAIIYRDMKPANIMLKPDGNITLIDFGTAREFKEKNLADTTCLGTVGYAAPEQFGGMGQTDARTDIYCLGATLYHLVTGCNPCEPPYEIQPIRSINPQLSSGLERIIIKCTQRNPEDRYQSCAELMYALEHYEEIDDKYRKQQKKKLNIFISSVSLMLAALIGAFSSIALNNRQIEKEYNKFLETGEKGNSYQEKNDNYISAIKTGYPDGYEAYDRLLNLYTGSESDLRLTTIEIDKVKELQNVNTTVKNNIDSLKSDKEKARLYFKIACDVFQYYSDDGKAANPIRGAIESQYWFNRSKDFWSLIDEKQREELKGDGFTEKNVDILINFGKFSETLENTKDVKIQEDDEPLSRQRDERTKTIDDCWNYLSVDFLEDLKDQEVDDRFKRMICKYGGFTLFRISTTDTMRKALGDNYSYDKTLNAIDEMLRYLEKDTKAKSILTSVQTVKKELEKANYKSEP